MKLSFFSLIALMVASIDNLKNMPGVALLGNSMIFFFLLAAVLFLIPTALVAAELSSSFPTKGGIYQWVKTALGQKWAVAAVWFQWINTMIWYPSMLTFIAATLTYLIDPKLAENKWYLVGVTLAIFWGLTWVNLKGIRASSKLVNVCSLLGTFLPMACLMGAAIFWLFQGEHLQIEFTAKKMLPSFSSSESWVSLVALMASFLGIELCGVHVNDIQNPKKNFPRAATLASLIIFLSMGLSSLAIALIVPKEEIHLLSGVMQVFQYLLTVLGASSLAPVAALLIAVGAIGTMVNWLIAPAKGLLQAAEDGYLPSFFLKTNSKGVASNILITQAVLVSFVSFIFLLPANPSESFWLLTALSTEFYMAMYVLMFLSACKLREKKSETNTSFRLPLKSLWFLSGSGMLGCFITIVFSFLPPEGSASLNPLAYAFQVLSYNILALLPLGLLYRYKKSSEGLQFYHQKEKI